MNKRQLIVFGTLLLTFAVSTFISVAFLFDQMTMGLPIPPMEIDVPPGSWAWQTRESF